MGPKKAKAVSEATKNATFMGHHPKYGDLWEGKRGGCFSVTDAGNKSYHDRDALQLETAHTSSSIGPTLHRQATSSNTSSVSTKADSSSSHLRDALTAARIEALSESFANQCFISRIARAERERDWLYGRAWSPVITPRIYTPPTPTVVVQSQPAPQVVQVPPQPAPQVLAVAPPAAPALPAAPAAPAVGQPGSWDNLPDINAPNTGWTRYLDRNGVERRAHPLWNGARAYVSAAPTGTGIGIAFSSCPPLWADQTPPNWWAYTANLNYAGRADGTTNIGPSKVDGFVLSLQPRYGNVNDRVLCLSGVCPNPQCWSHPEIRNDGLPGFKTTVFSTGREALICPFCPPNNNDWGQILGQALVQLCFTYR